MNCRRARKLVFNFIDGLDDESSRLELEKHLAECGECEKLASQLSRSMDLVHRAPVEKPDENFNWNVRLAIHKERQAIHESAASTGSLFRAWNVRYAASAVAGFAVIAVAGWLAIGNDMVTPDGGRGMALTEPQTNGVGVSAEEQTADEGGSTVTQPPSSVFTDRPAGRYVSSGERGAQPSATPKRGAIEASMVPVVLDSLIQAELKNRTPDEQVEYLQQQIQLFEQRLQKTKSRKNQ